DAFRRRPRRPLPRRGHRPRKREAVHTRARAAALRLRPDPERVAAGRARQLQPAYGLKVNALGAPLGAQVPRERLRELPADPAVLDDQRAELPEGEPVAMQVRGRHDGRRALALVKQRDLTKVIAGPQRLALLAVDRDGRLTAFDQVEGGAAGALLHDRL